MNEKNRHSMTTSSLDPFELKYEYRLLFSSAVVGMSVGVVVAIVLGANPLAVSVVKYVAPVCAVLGAAAGARHGVFFNLSNRFLGGSVVWALIGSTLAAAGSTLAIALVAVVVGTLAGFACGMIVGPLLGGKWRTILPLLGAGAGAVIQAGWANPRHAFFFVVHASVPGLVVSYCQELSNTAVNRHLFTVVEDQHHLWKS